MSDNDLHVLLCCISRYSVVLLVGCFIRDLAVNSGLQSARLDYLLGNCPGRHKFPVYCALILFGRIEHLSTISTTTIKARRRVAIYCLTLRLCRTFGARVLAYFLQ